MLSLKYLVLALAAVAEAGKLYGCAGSCIGKAITATGCSSSNSACICSSVLFMETIKDCAASDCTEAQTESALSVAEEFCNLIGDDVQLTHEKRGGGRQGHGRYRGGHGHGRPSWAGNGAPWGPANNAPAASAAPVSPSEHNEFPNWSAEGERFGQGEQRGGGREGFRGGRPVHGGPPAQPSPSVTKPTQPEYTRPAHYTPTPSVSTPAQPQHTQSPPKHPQPPNPAHSHSGQPTTTTTKPTWTPGPPAPEHTVW